MKKNIISLFCMVLALLMLLPCLVSSEKYTAEADALAAMGLFRGTGNGYELDREPTRAEAAVMLVRFLGKEKAASGLAWRAPFTDVPDWAKPYVQYLYENKLTAGTSDTKYSPDDLCSAQMYATFLLRALGYSDMDGDFRYAEAISFAKLKKLINEKDYDENEFLRDHMAAMSYCALGLSTANGSYTSLVRKLEADGAVTKAQADAFLTEYAQRYGDGVGYLKLYSDYEAAAAWMKKNIEDTDTPPVSFTLGGSDASMFKWKKSVGKETTVTDFAETERPAQRKVREIEYICESENIRIRLTLTTYPDYPVIEYGAHIDNISKDTSGIIRKFMSINAPIATDEGKTVIHYNQGSYGYAETEYQPFTRTLAKTTLNFSSQTGMPTCEFLPYFNAENRKSGGGVITAVNWQGGWESSFRAENGKVKFSAGQENAGFCMKGGESFKFPGIVLLFYKNGDWQEGQNIWRRWVVEHNLMRYTGRRDFKENVFVCSGFPGAEKDMSDIKAFAATGIPAKYNCVFELDAGWYDPGFSNWTYTGNWTRMADGYGNGGLRKISDLCHKNGMKFCMWFEPERVYSGTDFARTLGDSVIYLNGNEYVPYSSIRGGEYMGLINYGNKKAEDGVVAMLDRAIKEYGIDVYRQDFNTQNNGFWTAYDRYESNALGYARSGATENHACEGYINAWTRLEELNPGLIFDACAGGGRRYDLETMRFAFVHTKSDYWAEHNSQQCQNLGMYSWNIFTGTGFTNTYSQYDIRTRLTLSIGIGISTDPSLSSALAEWENMHKYIYCDYYALTDYSLSQNANIAMEFNSPEQGGGMAAAYLRAGGSFTVKLRGLDADANYRVWDSDSPTEMIMSGEKLMRTGCRVTRDRGVASAVLIFYEKTLDEQTDGTDLSGRIDTGDLSEQKNDEAEIAKLAAAAKVGENGAVFLCSDHDSSGGIYLIGDTLYSKLARTNTKNSEGWTKLDPNKVGIYVDTVYPLTTWGENGAFDVRAYVKQIKGYKLLWLDNSYGFGDADGNWTSAKRRICAIDSAGNVEYSSDEFIFRVCAYKTAGGRDMQFTCSDGNSAVYRLSEKLYEKLPLSSSEKTIHGETWTALKTDSVYFVRATSDCLHNADDSGLYETVYPGSMGAGNKVRLYVIRNSNGCFLYAENALLTGDKYLSDRWQMYFPYDGVLCHTEVYFVTGKARVDLSQVLAGLGEPW